jgi:hypothetical protein
MTEVSWQRKGMRNSEPAALASQAAKAHLSLVGGIVRVFEKGLDWNQTLPRSRVVSNNREPCCTW